jgi:hypothetical protein
MTRNGKITTTLIVAAIAAVGCTKDKSSQTESKDSQRTAKVVTVSMPTPAGDKAHDVTTPKINGPVSYADGEALFQAGKYVEATNVFEQYTVEKPNNPWGALHARSVRIQSRRYGEGREGIRRGASHRSGSSEESSEPEPDAD